MSFPTTGSPEATRKASIQFQARGDVGPHGRVCSTSKYSNPTECVPNPLVSSKLGNIQPMSLNKDDSGPSNKVRYIHT
ncbi:hypothetical protein I7I50_08988 [Histoplasma capsulatum G186AR]|uniref:Uncharacterized protein n=1 Tax=Ajellomyces capsulatus TaxID=5037 RepID=A0A8H8D146_AJECA|nr:hypothetical protein I7I52_06503 [Histoplasma capsulatum]QSS74011.1 hypothetical protein I7I50_08988 [Histoplasma capsulatum G186AR]